MTAEQDDWTIPVPRVAAGALGRTGRCARCGDVVRYSSNDYTWRHATPGADHAPAPERGDS